MNSGSTPSVQDYFADLQTPNTEDMKLQLEELIQQGSITPEEARTILLEKSSMEGIETDPLLQQAQMDALSELQSIGNSGGLRAQDRAKLSRIKSEEDAANRGNREAILRNMQSRGISGSGIELASQLQGQQDSAMRQSQRDMDVAALAEQQALQALLQGGQLAGDIQGQQFGQKAQVAQAQDAISRFNAQNQQQQINQNVNARNAAQAQNLQMKQEIANQNVGLRNQAQQYNKQLSQQDFQNQLAKRGGQSGIAQTNAQIAGQNSANKAAANNQMIGVGAGLASGGLGYAAAAQNANALRQGGAQPQIQQASQSNSYWDQQNPYGMKDGGIVHGEPSDFDTEIRALTPGEFVVKKEDVPHMMQKMHTKEDGSFDVGGFLDMVTGNKYGYKKGKK